MTGATSFGITAAGLRLTVRSGLRPSHTHSLNPGEHYAGSADRNEISGAFYLWPHTSVDLEAACIRVANVALDICRLRSSDLYAGENSPVEPSTLVHPEAAYLHLGLTLRFAKRGFYWHQIQLLN